MNENIIDVILLSFNGNNKFTKYCLHCFGCVRIGIKREIASSKWIKLQNKFYIHILTCLCFLQFPVINFKHFILSQKYNSFWMHITFIALGNAFTRLSLHIKSFYWNLHARNASKKLVVAHINSFCLILLLVYGRVKQECSKDLLQRWNNSV